MTRHFHSTAVIEGALECLDDVSIGPMSIVRGHTLIGRNTKIYGHVVIGVDGEHRSRGPVGAIRIGNDVMIREFSVVHRGTGDRETSIGDGCFLMRASHIAHDVVLGKEVTLSPNVTLGGHTRVHEGATIGIAAMTHQFTTIGAYAMVGMGAVVTRDVPPFALVMGNPARIARLNTYALERLDIDPDCVRLEGDQVVSEHPEVVRHLVEFTRDAGRRRR